MKAHLPRGVVTEGRNDGVLARIHLEQPTRKQTSSNDRTWPTVYVRRAAHERPSAGVVLLLDDRLPTMTRTGTVGQTRSSVRVRSGVG
jgi:hypothetical protein